MRWLLAGLILVSTGCTPGSEQRNTPRFATWRPVASWTGRGNATLPTFPIAAGRIRVSWEAKNQSPPATGTFKVRLHSADSGRVLTDVVDHQGEGADATEITDDHQRFYMTVESTNIEWSIRVEEAIASR